MSDFYFSELEDGEEIVFGVVTSSRHSSQSVVENGRQIVASLQSSERKLGVTNQRVIVESAGQPEATIVIPNEQVRRVFLDRDIFMGQPRLTLSAVESVYNQHVELDIDSLSAEDEVAIRTLFPTAEIITEGDNRTNGESEAGEKKKGLFGFLGF